MNMKNKIIIVLVSLGLLGAGILIGQRIRPMNCPPPPPPFGPMEEFGRVPGGMEEPGRPFRGEHMTPDKMKAMHDRMEKMKPQMEEFQKKIEAIREASRVKMLGLLRDDQKAKFNEIQENREQMIHAMGERKPKHFGKGEMFPRVRHFEFLNTIIYKPLLERMSKDLNLDEQQKKSFEEILVQRRKEVLDLIDSTPPPSIEAWGERPPPPPPSPF